MFGIKKYKLSFSKMSVDYKHRIESLHSKLNSKTKQASKYIGKSSAKLKDWQITLMKKVKQLGKAAKGSWYNSLAAIKSRKGYGGGDVDQLLCNAAEPRHKKKLDENCNV
jgi:3-oxoacyl-[acyl-carrier-protein] synthase III